MSDVRELVEQILADYPRARGEEFRHEERIGLVFSAIATALSETAPLRRRPAVVARWSRGRRAWADVPWIALLDGRETTTVGSGVFVSLLFRGDGSGVALCVMQGTAAAGRRGRVARTVTRIRAHAGDMLAAGGFELEQRLDLHASTRRARDYERATAAFKLYERGAVPDDEALARDLDTALAAVDLYRDGGRTARSVAVVYVDQDAADLLSLGLDERMWAWRRAPRPQDGIGRGTLLLFASGFSGGNLLQEVDAWQRHRLARVVAARLTSSLRRDLPMSAEERQILARRPYRVRFEVRGEERDVTLDGDQTSRALVTAMRRSALQSGQPVVLEDASPLLALFDEPSRPRRHRSRGRNHRAEVTVPLADVAAALRADVGRSGLQVPADELRGLLAALVAKPFVILTGTSGSGKTQRALRLGEWFGGHRSRVVAVRPDWTGPEPLLGYQDALQQPDPAHGPAWAVPATLEFLLAAHAEPSMPYLLVLDEMNLAHVEHYLSDFLSGVESRAPVLPDLVRRVDGSWRARRGTRAELLPLPSNLFVIGTVNVDETTYLFSPKVLDRAATFELRTAADELDPGRRRPTAVDEAAPALLATLLAVTRDDDWHVANPPPFHDELVRRLRDLHRLLALSGHEFGHRAFRESLRFAAILAALGEVGGDRALDQIVLLKILPRIHGARARAEPVLLRLLAFANEPDAQVAAIAEADPETVEAVAEPLLEASARKLRRMLEAVRVNQFVAFAE